MEQKDIILMIFIVVVGVITLFYLRKDEQRDNYGEDKSDWNQTGMMIYHNL